jgi:DNA-binding transcriptional LysR family regulator
VTNSSSRIGTRVNSWKALKTAVLSGAGVAPIWCMLAETEPRLIRISESVASHHIGLWLTSLEGLRREAPQQAVWNLLFRRIQQKS